MMLDRPEPEQSRFPGQPGVRAERKELQLEATTKPDLIVDRPEMRPVSFVLDHYEHRIKTLEAELSAARAALIAIQALAKTALPGE